MLRPIFLAGSVALLSACGGSESSSEDNSPEITGEISSANMQEVARNSITASSSSSDSATLGMATAFSNQERSADACDSGSVQFTFSGESSGAVEFFQCEQSGHVYDGGMSFTASGSENGFAFSLQFNQLTDNFNNTTTIVDGSMAMSVTIDDSGTEESTMTTSITAPHFSVTENGETTTIQEMSMVQTGVFSLVNSSGTNSTYSMYITGPDGETFHIYTKGSITTSLDGTSTGTVVIEGAADLLYIVMQNGEAVLQLDEGKDGSIDHEEPYVDEAA